MPVDRDDLGFGYKAVWITVRGTVRDELASQLNLSCREAADAADAIQAAHESISTTGVFVTKGGWTVAVNPPLADEANAHRFVEVLSRTFGEVHLYISHRVSSCFGWVRSDHGRILRAWYEADAELLFDEGDILEPEKSIRANQSDDEFFPDEEHVIEIARAWSFDPLTLRRDDVVGAALICRARA